MRFIWFVVIAILILVSDAWAKTPPEVMDHYKSYRAELEAKNYKKAADHAYDAWQKAEETLGDHRTTGDLAQNYLDVGSHAGHKFKKMEPAAIRAVELAHFYGESASQMRLQREVSYAALGAKFNKGRTLKKRLPEIEAFAKENGLENSTFMGEIYTMRAAHAVKKADHDDADFYSEKAKSVFENAKDGYVTEHPILATLFSGYGKEGNDEYVPALMEYQTVMQNLENQLPRDHPYITKALGRWMLMRDKIKREGMFEDAEAAGMCECWPYDKPRNEDIKPVKRVPPIMPREAYMSGFSIVEFDLNDDGSTTNIRVLESWPPDIFEESSKKSVAKWQYTQRDIDETDTDRTDIITTIRYKLTDRDGNLIE